MEVLQIERVRTGIELEARKPAKADTADSRVLRALLVMQQNVEQPLPITTFAEKLGLPIRTLERLS